MAMRCGECNGKMKEVESGVWECTKCGNTVDIYEDDSSDAMYDDYYLNKEEDSDDDIPEGCAACGGPYPKCTSSCSAFDD